jgi:hypothetical protein
MHNEVEASQWLHHLDILVDGVRQQLPQTSRGL